jgi:hypothetical protein
MPFSSREESVLYSHFDEATELTMRNKVDTSTAAARLDGLNHYWSTPSMVTLTYAFSGVN